jgi:hypothetical protein
MPRPAQPWRHAGLPLLILAGGSLIAEACARGLGVGLGILVQAGVTAACGWSAWRQYRDAPRWRPEATAVASGVAAAVAVWFLVRHGRPLEATGLAGVIAMVTGCWLGIAGIHLVLSGSTGVTGVARAVVDEAVRMRASLGLALLVLVLVPTLPLALDHSERLHYRMQFLLSWSLGVTGLILSLLTIVLACGSICGDIDSGRIHMTLVKPLQRWEYLLGKWLGIALFDLLMVILVGAGTATFVRLLAATEATDARDRAAVTDQVLTARVRVEPEPANPAEYDAAIAAAIRRLEDDEPEAFARNPGAVQRRIRQEYEWQWHTVTPDTVSTFVFRGLGAARRRAAAGGDATLQLQLKPRANNVDVDLADVRFAIWLNDRPWPMVDGSHVEQTLPTQVSRVLDLPVDAVDDDGVLRLTVANRNLVPAGETTPTAITFSPGDGLRILHRAGGFDGNFLRCLAVIWIKLTMVAAVAVAAASCLGLPMAILAALVVYATALGSGFLRDALGLYSMDSTSFLGAAVERAGRAAGLAGELRFYEAFRMLFGYVTDAALWLTPAFSDFDAVGRLATGMLIPTADVFACLWRIGVVYPLVIGLAAWALFERRDLIRSST